MSNQYTPTSQIITNGYYYLGFGTGFTYGPIPNYTIGSISVVGEFTLETITNYFNDCSYSYGLAIKLTSDVGDIYYIKWDNNIITGTTGTFDDNNLTTDINEALLFERVTYDELKSLVSPPWGGFGPGYTVGDIQCWLRIINYRDVTQFQYFKIHFQFYLAGLLPLNDVTTDITFRPDEGQSWNIEPYSFIFKPVSGCSWNCRLQEQTTIWSRASGDCVDLSGATLPNGNPMTYDDLSEKRKAVIFQYKNNSAGFSKKQQFSRLARGLGKPRGKTYATQGYNVTNPNVQNLPVVGKNVPTVVEDGSGNFVTQDVFMGTTLVCAGANKISGLTTQNDTPGPPMTITNYPTVPLTNYIVQRTYRGGSEKWPQYGPNTGQPRLPKYARNTGTKPGMNFWRPGSS
jgi:hypothetical protein